MFLLCLCCAGDRLIEINDINIEEKTHEEVASMIKESGTTVSEVFIKANNIE